ncbi:MAG: hypothetical protein WEK74_00740 [Hydrogenophaga sp.]
MPHTRTLQTLVATLALASLTACGGGSNDEISLIPTGSALPNVQFADSGSYFPLDKIKTNGSFYNGSEADFGTINPAYRANNQQQSRWAIDASAKVEGNYALRYTMKLTPIKASEISVAKLQENLRIDDASGLITQFCAGFPNCYENTSDAAEDFLVSVEANAVGAKGSLQRDFIFRVR